MIKNAIAKTETIATTRTGRYQFKKVPETIDFLLVLLVLGESRTNRRLLTIALLCHMIQSDHPVNTTSMISNAEIE